MLLVFFCAYERTAKYCGVSVKKKKRNVRRESKERNKGSPLYTPGEKRTCKLESLSDGFDLFVIKAQS